MESKVINVKERVLSVNDKNANLLREFYAKNNKFVINFMSSPGSGKTTLLEAMSGLSDFRFCVIEGDLETNRDADRLENKGILARQITTGEACHLEAKMILNILPKLESDTRFKASEFVIIENVGNLVCPASYDLGANANVVLLSVPEGDDKVLKYPSMFLCADLVVISKCDLIPHFNFRVERVLSDMASLRNGVEIMQISTKDSKSIENLKNRFLKWRDSKYQTSHIFR
ncbi:hydrogenase nickel incorporation protein HypB [Helicobacter saguini]|uniref:Hydrogenase accessory protein HypB n=1 Tax=Helicobacter saguini TaxID=1548018 RepID=A0A347W5Z7_9HELI|nr:hydrogenase nickel incorporation protein HypB [Helicobacter saguini]MWV61225.1 hydrogenase nickel incorporation protein HypB [Helicobacter saguini]MWV68108.1 hydrogenase nickel incorporation protein HypB [Helicobacter saguini]MWV70428.1 hydrogenase nickel incorporation protein HypB [Helicobacter saguini]MWV72329.1 hydrogenase nickel incorporation protein HypB [Helicobacter saguini]TLD92981.1 hydrogenase accessory protein HypB [Helicobacter saguini]